MTDFLLAGVAIALISLIFSSLPFIQLIYVLACSYALNWNDLYILTGFYLVAMVGGELFKRLSK